MKRVILTAGLFTILLTGCKSEEPTTENYKVTEVGRDYFYAKCIEHNRKHDLEFYTSDECFWDNKEYSYIAEGDVFEIVPYEGLEDVISHRKLDVEAAMKVEGLI
ncbi:hypothetical protein LCM01_20270 [Bacillus thuringiensis]|uniref:hypothetical protein n=1 Tax=Bacillus thuringiensis TaxID=1428 RepID=UPI001CD7DEBC|nr:hypothetical protein [Bacillus thuringiensis]MCA1002738.1 hypothetical protein [Bacillus thuringiensis]